MNNIKTSEEALEHLKTILDPDDPKDVIKYMNALAKHEAKMERIKLRAEKKANDDAKADLERTQKAELYKIFKEVEKKKSVKEQKQDVFQVLNF